MLFPDDDELPRVPQQQQQQPPAAPAPAPAAPRVLLRTTVQADRERAQLTAALLAVSQGKRPDPDIPLANQPAIVAACEQFKNDQMHPKMFHCTECKERTWANEKQDKVAYRGTICVRCVDQQNKDATASGDINAPYKFSAGNDMDPLNGPQEAILQWLHIMLVNPPTLVEYAMISPHDVIMHMVRLVGGAAGFKGSCISLTRDLTPLLKILPRLPKELSIITVVKPGQDHSECSLFKARKQKLKNIFKLLKENSLLWNNNNNITIDATRLESLPVNGSVFRDLPQIVLQPNPDHVNPDVPPPNDNPIGPPLPPFISSQETDDENYGFHQGAVEENREGDQIMHTHLFTAAAKVGVTEQAKIRAIFG